MSCYWYCVCDEHKQSVSAGSSHASGNFHLDYELGQFIQAHSGCKVRFLCDPCDMTHPEVIDYVEFKSCEPAAIHSTN